MKVLLDECTPRILKREIILHGHDCVTVQEAGWSGKKNGELLDLAEEHFDVLVTIDANIEYQQSLAGRQISLIVLLATSNRLVALAPLFSRCIRQIEDAKPGKVILIRGPV